MIDAASARRFPARDLAVPDPLSAYLNCISRGALLTQREEVELQPYGPTEDAPTLAEFVADESAPEILDTVVRRMELDRIRRVVEALPARARYVVVRRYGLDGREPARLAELAAELGVSRQGVSQLQQRSVRRLKVG